MAIIPATSALLRTDALELRDRTDVRFWHLADI
jgi:hypothetical protein